MLSNSIDINILALHDSDEISFKSSLFKKIKQRGSTITVLRMLACSITYKTVESV